jgi:serine protease Do
VIISDVKSNTPAIAAGLQIGDILLSVDGRAAENLPFVGLQFLSRETGDKVRLEILRGTQRLGFDVKVMEPPHDMDQIAALADPEKSLVPALGILGVEIDAKVAAMAPDLRDPFGILVAARAAGASVEVPLNTGDVIRTLNGEPMTTLDRLRGALKALPAGASVALQIQRDERLMYVAFTMDAL